MGTGSSGCSLVCWATASGDLLLDLLHDGGGQDYLAVRHWVVTQIVAQGSLVQTRVEHDLGNVNGTCCKHKDLGLDGDLTLLV